jgi:hypothetical protein
MRRRAFARLAVAWALAASASPAVRTDDGAPRARNATAAAPRSLGASFHVELADGRLSASVATLLPAARSVLVVDVEDVIRDFAKEGRYDVLYGVRGGAAARALWRAGAASFLLGNGSALPLAEFAADVVVVDARAGKESEIPNFKGSSLGRFPLVSADFWTSDHLSERSRSVDAFPGTRARGTLTLKRR